MSTIGLRTTPEKAVKINENTLPPSPPPPLWLYSNFKGPWPPHTRDVSLDNR
jgi:hypothetical protein